MRTFIKLVVLSLIVFASGAAEALRCEAIFQTETESISAEEIENTIVSLTLLRMRLDLARARGDRAIYTQTLESDYVGRKQKLVAYLETQHVMTEDQLVQKMRALIESFQDELALQESSIKKVQKEEHGREIERHNIDGSKIIFWTIEPGSFAKGDEGQQRQTLIKKSFDMAATQTTQIVWRKIALAAQARFGDEFASLNPDPSFAKGMDLNPVEMVSVADVQLWLTAANKLINAGDPVIQDVMPGTHKGARLRLPTDNEWEFVVRARGEAQGAYHFGDDPEDIDAHAWYLKNADRMAHPVAQKEPLMFSGYEFFDLHGNVNEWVNAWHSHLKNSAVSRGGSAVSRPEFLRSFIRGGNGPLSPFGALTGFRIVRTTKIAF